MRWWHAGRWTLARVGGPPNRRSTFRRASTPLGSPHPSAASSSANSCPSLRLLRAPANFPCPCQCMSPFNLLALLKKAATMKPNASPLAELHAEKALKASNEYCAIPNLVTLGSCHISIQLPMPACLCKKRVLLCCGAHDCDMSKQALKIARSEMPMPVCACATQHGCLMHTLTRVAVYLLQHGLVDALGREDGQHRLQQVPARAAQHPAVQ